MADDLEGEVKTLDFRGHLLLDANLAETTSGFTSVLGTQAGAVLRHLVGSTPSVRRVLNRRLGCKRQSDDHARSACRAAAKGWQGTRERIVTGAATVRELRYRVAKVSVFRTPTGRS